MVDMIATLSVNVKTTIALRPSAGVPSIGPPKPPPAAVNANKPPRMIAATAIFQRDSKNC